jgi:hypothetical protein
MDPRVLTSWYISITAFKFCCDDTTWESYVAALFDYFNVQNIWVYLTLIKEKLPLDGSNDASWIFFRLPCSNIHEKTSSGARLALLMGVAPEAIVKEDLFWV